MSSSSDQDSENDRLIDPLLGQKSEKNDLDKATEAYVKGEPFLPFLNAHLMAVSQRIFETIDQAKPEVQRIMRFVKFAQVQLFSEDTKVTLRVSFPKRSKKPSFQLRTNTPDGYQAVFTGQKIPLLRAAPK